MGKINTQLKGKLALEYKVEPFAKPGLDADCAKYIPIVARGHLFIKMDYTLTPYRNMAMDFADWGECRFVREHIFTNYQGRQIKRKDATTKNLNMIVESVCLDKKLKLYVEFYEKTPYKKSDINKAEEIAELERDKHDKEDDYEEEILGYDIHFTPADLKDKRFQVQP